MATNTHELDVVLNFFSVTNPDDTFGNVRDGFVASVSGIPFSGRPVGMRFKRDSVSGSSGTLTKHYCWNDAHGSISGYKQLTTSKFGLANTITTNFTDDPGSPPEETLIEEFATAAGAMDGKDLNGSSDTFSVKGRYQNTSSRTIKTRVKVYHRTAGGTETLLATGDTAEMSTTTSIYDFSVTIPESGTQSFGTNEILVFKYYVLNEGVPV